MKKKYLVIPSTIKSKNDNDFHHISAKMLMSLYRVNEDECIVYDPNHIHMYTRMNLTILTPQFDGNYNLPKEKKEIEYNFITKRLHKLCWKFVFWYLYKYHADYIECYEGKETNSFHWTNDFEDYMRGNY